MEMRVKETIDSAVAAVTEVKKIYRALFFGLIALLQGLVLVTVGDAGLSGITTNQWLIIALSVLGVIGGVYGMSSGD